jgi:hypothetical protein
MAPKHTSSLRSEETYLYQHLPVSCVDDGRAYQDRLVSHRKGQPKPPHRSGSHSKVGMGWGSEHTAFVVPAIGILGDELDVHIKRTRKCPECGEVPRYDHRQWLACKCTVWNEGTARPRAPVSDLGKEVQKGRRYRQFRRFGADVSRSM